MYTKYHVSSVSTSEGGGGGGGDYTLLAGFVVAVCTTLSLSSVAQLDVRVT